MLVRDTLEEAVLGRVLKEMRTSIKDADLTKVYEVYSTKVFAVDYTEDGTEALDVLIGIKGDERMLSKIAESAIKAIEKRVELETKLKPDLVAIAAEAIHSYASSAEVKTK